MYIDISINVCISQSRIYNHTPFIGDGNDDDDDDDACISITKCMNIHIYLVFQ